jgi:hypothetical protein
MTTDTQSGINMNQALIWLGVLIVVLAVVYAVI